MVKSSIFKLRTTKYKIYNKIYKHNLGYVEVVSENAITTPGTCRAAYRKVIN